LAARFNIQAPTNDAFLVEVGTDPPHSAATFGVRCGHRAPLGVRRALRSEERPNASLPAFADFVVESLPSPSVGPLAVDSYADDARFSI
jgi:hypothetical protein